MRLVEDIVELPNGQRVDYLREERADAVTIICLKRDQVLVQKEYSYPPDAVLYQFPGGVVEAGEDIRDSASRELLEESGIKALEMREIGWYYMNNRRHDRKMVVFLCTQYKENQAHEGDPEEDIESEWMPLDRVGGLIKQGKIVNYSILAAWPILLGVIKE